jgi:hypothetical protein
MKLEEDIEETTTRICDATASAIELTRTFLVAGSTGLRWRLQSASSGDYLRPVQLRAGKPTRCRQNGPTPQGVSITCWFYR